MAVNSVETIPAARVECRLCTLPARSPVYDHENGQESVFCCAGCRNVWRILIESGQASSIDDLRETPLYKRALAAGLLGNQSEILTPPTEKEPVDYSFERKGSTIQDKRQCILQIGGMWCSSCAWLISQTLLRSRGVVSAEVSFSSDTARVVFKPARTDETVLKRVVDNLGYTAVALGETNESDPRVAARRRELLRVFIGFIFAMNAMMTQLILYAGFLEGISKQIRSGVPWLLLALSVPVFVSAYPLFRRAWKAAYQGIATMETLVSIGATAALGYSVWQTVAGTGHVYYDTADMLLGLVMVGKYIESGTRQNANDALTLLYGLLPRKATILKGEREIPVAIAQLADGDVILVKAGERIAADGIIEDGTGTVDESLLSGESKPVNKRVGERTIGGTILMDGALTVKVNRTGDTGTLNIIIQHVQDALENKTPVEKLADRISRVFVPIVLSLAITTGVALAVFGHAGAEAIMTRVVAVLVIACPCALGIATPMAISAGVASAARSGILISDGGAFELLKKVRCMAFDKTGTVTDASFNVRRTIGGGENEFSLLAALERRSGHPIAKAITAHFASNPAHDGAVTNFRTEEGIGIAGSVGIIDVFAGNEKAVINAGLALTAEQAAFMSECTSNGLTVIFWGIAGSKVLGGVALGDQIRPEAKGVIASLQQMGISAELLSGDSVTTTAYVADQLSITRYLGAASPPDKAHVVKSLKESGGNVCMVGDGVNDAPALAEADIGIALASGTDIAARTAQVTLLTPDMTLLPKLIHLSRRTVGIMNLNLFWAFLYNVVCIPLAMLGKVTPIWAVSAMLISSLTVILNTQRLKKN